MRSTMRARIAVTGLTATTLLAGAAIAEAIDTPPSRTVPAGAPSPVTFKKTLLGAGLKQGQKLPATATVRKQFFARWQDGDESAINTTAPKGQAQVAVTGQIITIKGKVFRTFYGTTGPGILTIEGQFTPTTGAHPGIGDAGALTEFPSSLKPPAGSSYVVWTLFRAGADPNSGE